MFSITILALIGSTLAQSCANSAMCVQQYKGTVQSGCGGVSDSSSCLCQNYRAIMANCFSGCSDPASLAAMKGIETDMSGYCQNAGSLAPTATLSPINNAFYANGAYAQSTLVINDGPTGLAIPFPNGNQMGNNFGNPSQATISLAPTPIKMSSAEITSSTVFFTLSCIALASL